MVAGPYPSESFVFASESLRPVAARVLVLRQIALIKISFVGTLWNLAANYSACMAEKKRFEETEKRLEEAIATCNLMKQKCIQQKDEKEHFTLSR